uniref:FAS1 domain-containing protein n=1 Tax=Talaromyces marneffei PM1 TaxID=1077442 RepID=A0A093Y5W1_TALMA
MKNSVQKVQLTIYATILSLTLVWLVISVTDTAVLALREWEFLPCVTRHHHHISTEKQQPPPFNIEYLNFIDGDDEQKEDNTKAEVPSPQNVIMPPVTGGGDASNLIVSDLLVKTPKINVFASLTRDFYPIASRLNDNPKTPRSLRP